MTEISKYYTPELSEFYIGFEYEIKYGALLDFVQDTYSEDDFNEGKFRDGTEFRVKYLDVADIERGGWTKTDNDIHFRNEVVLFGDKFKLFEYKKEHNIFYLEYLRDIYDGALGLKVIISVWNTGTMSLSKNDKPQHLFNGNIKNISELKQVIKMLSI